MKHLFFAIVLFSSHLYIGLASIFGLKVTTENGSNSLYKIYCIAMFVTFLFFYMREYVGKRISQRHVITVLIFLFYIISGILAGYATDTSMLSLVCFGFPSIGVAIYYSEHDNLSNVVKWIDFLLPVFSLSLIFSLRQLFLDITEGTRYYSQSLSYFAAYCFILYLFLLLFGNKYERFPIFTSRLYKYISILMLPYLIAMLFFSGGRGAFGTLFVGILLLLYLYKKHKRINKTTVVKSLIAIVLFGVVALGYLSSDIKDIFDMNFDRVFSFFDTSKNMGERTSGRNDVMNVAIDMFSNSPIWGYGLFSYKDVYQFLSGQPYPHNIFLEVLLQGGLTFFIIFFLFLWRIFLKLRLLLKRSNQELVVVFAVFSMTMLLYSGSYMQSSYFLFFVFYVFNYQLKKSYVKR